MSNIIIPNLGCDTIKWIHSVRQNRKILSRKIMRKTQPYKWFFCLIRDNIFFGITTIIRNSFLFCYTRDISFKNPLKSHYEIIDSFPNFQDNIFTVYAAYGYRTSTTTSNLSSTATCLSNHPIKKNLTIVIGVSSWHQNSRFQHDFSLIFGFLDSVNENTIRSLDFYISDFCNC